MIVELSQCVLPETKRTAAIRQAKLEIEQQRVAELAEKTRLLEQVSYHRYRDLVLLGGDRKEIKGGGGDALG